MPASRSTGRHLTLETEVFGPVAAALSVLDHPRLRYASSVGLVPGQVRGTLATRMRGSFPLIDALALEDAALNASGTLDGAAAGRRFSGPGSDRGCAPLRSRHERNEDRGRRADFRDSRRRRLAGGLHRYGRDTAPVYGPRPAYRTRQNAPGCLPRARGQGSALHRCRVRSGFRQGQARGGHAGRRRGRTLAGAVGMVEAVRRGGQGGVRNRVRERRAPHDPDRQPCRGRPPGGGGG